MRWEEISAPDFPEAVVKSNGVCVLPIGVLEKHGDHLPLGQDGLAVYAISLQAAERESVMVFPLHWFGSINEARNHPGTIALRYDLLVEILDSLCEEIARNGFTKIILANGHGGNTGLLASLFDRWREKAHKALVYMLDVWVVEPPSGLLQSSRDGHGGETETSMALALYPHLVASDTPPDYGAPNPRMQHIEKAQLSTPIGWFAKFPRHFSGDTTKCTPERGKALVELMITKLAHAIKVVKNDQVGPVVYREFLDQCGL